MTRVLVCGGRNFNYQRIVDHILDDIYVNHDCQWDTIIHGAANGADTCAHIWAKAHQALDIEKYIPDWNKYGRAAGAIRNKQMLDEGKPDYVIAFPGGKGTYDMMKQAKAAGVEVISYND